MAVTSFPGSLRDQVCPYQSAPDELISLATLGHLVILFPCTDLPHPSSQCGLCRSEQGHAVPVEKQAGVCRDEGPQSSCSASKSPSPKASLCKLGVKKALVCCLWKHPSLRLIKTPSVTAHPSGSVRQIFHGHGSKPLLPVQPENSVKTIISQRLI